MKATSSWHASCFMSSMNVFGTTIRANTDPQKVNYKADISRIDLNMGGIAGLDKITFDSLLANLKSETIERKQNDYKDYKIEHTERNNEYSDKSKAIDSRSEDRKSEESYRTPQKSDSNIDAGNRDEGYRADAMNHKTDQSDNKAALEDKDGSNDSSVINKDTEESDDVNQKESGEGNALKISSILFDIVNSKAGELTKEAESVEGEEEALIVFDKESGQGLQKEALLSELLQGKPEAVVHNNSKDTAGLLGVKSGDILKGLIDAEAGKQQTDTAAKSETLTGVKTETVKAEIVNTEVVNTENNLKAGELLNKTADLKAEGIVKELISAQVKADNPESEDTDLEIEELLKNLDKNISADKKAEIKQDKIKEQKLQDFMGQKDIQQGNNAKAAVSKDMPGMVENLLRESGVRQNVTLAPKATAENSDTNNISMLSDVSAKSGGPKINMASSTGTIAKPSGFADVVNKIVYVAKGDNKLGVTVEHKDLGQLSIKLSLEKGVVNVHINAADKAGREFVESNIQQIVDSLSKSGVSVGGFSVGLNNHQNREGFSSSNSNKNDKAFSIDGIEQREYSKAAANVYNDNGRVSVFA